MMDFVIRFRHDKSDITITIYTEKYVIDGYEYVYKDSCYDGWMECVDDKLEEMFNDRLRPVKCNVEYINEDTLTQFKSSPILKFVEYDSVRGEYMDDVTAYLYYNTVLYTSEDLYGIQKVDFNMMTTEEFVENLSDDENKQIDKVYKHKSKLISNII